MASHGEWTRLRFKIEDADQPSAEATRAEAGEAVTALVRTTPQRTRLDVPGEARRVKLRRNAGLSALTADSETAGRLWCEPIGPPETRMSEPRD